MELLYYWIDDENSFKENGFHLSARFKFTTKFSKRLKKTEIEILENQEYIKNFYGIQITSLTAIVGENGSGKTNLLWSIISKLTGYKYVFGYDYFFAFLDGDKVIILETFTINNTGWKVVCRGYKKVRIRQIPNAKNIWNHPVLSWYKPPLTSIIYFNPIYDFRDYPFSHVDRPFADVSSTYLVWNDKEDRSVGELDMVAVHKSEEILRQYTVTQLSIFEDPSLNKVNIPKKLTIGVHRAEPERRDLGSYSRILFDWIRSYASSTFQVHNSLIDKVKKSKKGKTGLEYQIQLKDKAKTWYLTNIMDHFFAALAEQKDVAYDKLLKVKLEDITFYQQNEIAFKKNVGAEIPWNLVSIDAFKSIIRELFNKQKFIDFNVNQFIETAFRIIDQDAEVNVDNDAEFILPSEIAIEFIKLNESYCKALNNKYSISFLHAHWRNISSGELAYLNLFARIHYAYKSIITKDPKTRLVYLLLDEADHSFHPHWQKSLISILISFLKAYAPINFQVILTSHSPIILSDILSSNVVFLQKEVEVTKVLLNIEQERTFGANIHTLFSDTFFIKDGVIGEYAISIIQNLIAEIEHSKKLSHKRISEIKKIIFNIGDEVIHDRLKDLLDEKYNTRESLISKASRLKQELADVERKLGEV